jgi:hypothetical protein
MGLLKKMGLFKMSTGTTPDSVIPTQPLPRADNFKIKKIEQVGQRLVVLIVYPDCTNFEGKKILVYNTTIEHLVSQKHLDPHFSDGDYLSPIARFLPTEGGWNLAVKFCQI